MRVKRFITKAVRILFNPPSKTNCDLDRHSRVCSGTQINYSSMGKYSYCGHNCFILRARIGSYVSIADNCRIGGAIHPIERVSSSPVFHEGKNILKTVFVDFSAIPDKEVIIDSDVWICAGVTILSGVSIGVGSVVGAGSVVTQDIPAYEIWAGNPAKKIRDRFPEEIKQGLLLSKWWTWDEEKINDYAALFDNPEKFIRKVEHQEE